MIQGKMSMREIGIVCLMAFVVLLCNLAAAGVERSNWEEAQEPLLAYLTDSGRINQEMAEFLWLNCRIELIHAKKALEDLESHSPEDRSSDSEKLSEDRLSGNAETRKTSDCLHPLVQKILLDCLKERNMMLPICGEEKGFKSWYTRYLGFLFARSSSSSRRELIQRIEGEPVSAPTVSPPSQATSVPTASNAPFPSSPPYLPFSIHDLNDSSLQIKTIKYTSKKGSSSKKKSGKKDGSNTAVIAAVAIAAVAVSLVLLCVLCCCMCCCKSSNRRGRNDEKPLLCLSLSDHSMNVSSRKSLDLGTLMYDEHQGNQLVSGSLNQSKTSDKFYADPQTVTDSEVKIPVGNSAGTGINSDSIPNPPGMVGKPSCPPLKPPPGRAIPPKLPVSNAAPPPPTPPVPPPAPPMKPAPNGPRPPPPPSGMKAGPRPPPPPGGVPPARPPPVGLKGPRRAVAAPNNESTSSEYGGSNKTKLKPFFWDKVNAKPDNAMVWDQIKAGSFQFNEEMIENLFGYAPTVKNQKEGKKGYVQDAPQYIQIIDQKKSQNLSILLKALNVTTEEVCDALQEGNELPAELIQTLLKMAPTSEEELKLRLYSGELSRLGPADRFLKVLVEIPFAFKRLETLHLMCTLQEEATGVKESFKILEVACTELRKSRLFLKLLEAVLKTGNRMNDGTFRGGAQAFKLDTLLKLSDVKGIDGKTTLLHFVVQEIIRSEGIRAARAARESQSFSSIKTEDLTMEDSSQESDEQMRSLGLQVVSGLGNQLENVKKAAGLDADGLTGTVCRIGNGFVNSRNFLNTEMKDIDEDNGFHQALKSFVQNAEAEVMFLLEEEKRIMSLVKSTADYFHGTAGKDEGLRLFVIVRDFLIILDKVCKEVKNIPRKPAKKEEPPGETLAPPRKSVAEDTHQRLSSAISNKRHDSSSSDDD